MAQQKENTNFQNEIQNQNDLVQDHNKSDSDSESSESEEDFDRLFRGKNQPVRNNHRPKKALSPRSYVKMKVCKKTQISFYIVVLDKKLFH